MECWCRCRIHVGSAEPVQGVVGSRGGESEAAILILIKSNSTVTAKRANVPRFPSPVPLPMSSASALSTLRYFSVKSPDISSLTGFNCYRFAPFRKNITRKHTAFQSVWNCPVIFVIGRAVRMIYEILGWNCFNIRVSCLIYCGLTNKTTVLLAIVNY